jgi:hypothetical protein
MGRRVFLLEGSEHLVNSGLSNVHQHVRIGEPLHSANRGTLQCRGYTIDSLSAIVLFEDFLISHRCDPVIIKLEPSRLSVRFDQGKIMATMQVPGVHQDTMQLIQPRF